MLHGNSRQRRTIGCLSNICRASCLCFSLLRIVFFRISSVCYLSWIHNFYGPIQMNMYICKYVYVLRPNDICTPERPSSPVARPITLHGLLEIISLHFSIVLSGSMKFSPGGASPPAWLFQNPRWPRKYLRMCCNAGLAWHTTFITKYLGNRTS